MQTPASTPGGVGPRAASGATASEIGPGGGRWTRYLLGFDRVYAVDYHPELLAELGRTLRSDRIVAVHNNGTDFPGVPDAGVDYVPSFGVFVHLEVHLIEGYLGNLARVLRPGADVVVQYRPDEGDGAQQRALIEAAGYRIREEDTTSLWHSSVVRFTPGVSSGG